MSWSCVHSSRVHRYPIHVFKPHSDVNVCELTGVQVGGVGFDVHHTVDSLSDHYVSSSIPLPHLKYGPGPCIGYVQVVYEEKTSVKGRRTKSIKCHQVVKFYVNENYLNIYSNVTFIIATVRGQSLNPHPGLHHVVDRQQVVSYFCPVWEAEL